MPVPPPVYPQTSLCMSCMDTSYRRHVYTYACKYRYLSFIYIICIHVCVYECMCVYVRVCVYVCV